LGKNDFLAHTHMPGKRLPLYSGNSYFINGIRIYARIFNKIYWHILNMPATFCKAGVFYKHQHLKCH
jgi:hypothetical protein